jgi:hypothetical protein
MKKKEAEMIFNIIKRDLTPGIMVDYLLEIHEDYMLVMAKARIEEHKAHLEKNMLVMAKRYSKRFESC